MADATDDGRLELLPDMPDTPRLPPAKKSRDVRTLRPAADAPVARIAVDIPLAHLDRPFDYLVSERLDGKARPGVRVRVRFAGQLTDGYLLERVAASEHPGRLSYLERVVSAEPVLTPQIAGLARQIGTLETEEVVARFVEDSVRASLARAPHLGEDDFVG